MSPPENGLINANKESTSSGYLLNTTLEFSCIHGYSLVGSRFNLCTNNGTHVHWKGGPAICLPITTIMTTNAPSNAQTTTIIAVSASTCKLDLASSVVSFHNTTTIVKQCMDNYRFLNASFDSLVPNNAALVYQCLHTTADVFNAKCMNGTLHLQQNCHELIKSYKACTSPPKIANGYNKYGSTQHGKKTLYQCFNGYELSKGHADIECVNGEWVGAIPQCAKINCGFPGVLNHGRILYIGTLSEYTYQPYMNTVGQNKQIRYECDKDFHLEGPSGSTCINGKWKPSMKLAKCVKESSASKPEILNGPLQYHNDFEQDEEILDDYIPTSKLLRQNIKLYETRRHSSGNPGSVFGKTAEFRSLKLKRLKKHKVKKFQFDDQRGNASVAQMKRRRRKKKLTKYRMQNIESHLSSDV